MTVQILIAEDVENSVFTVFDSLGDMQPITTEDAHDAYDEASAMLASFESLPGVFAEIVYR